MKPRIQAGDDDKIPPPSSMTVDADPRVILYRADGTPLVRPIGFKA